MDSKVQKNEIRIKLKLLQEIKEWLHEEMNSISDQVIVYGTSALLNPKPAEDTLTRVEKTISMTTSCFTKLAENISTLKDATVSTNPLKSNCQITEYGQKPGLSQHFDTDQSPYEDLKTRLDNLTEKFSELENKVDPLMSSVHRLSADFSGFKSGIHKSFQIVEENQKNIQLLTSQLSVGVGEMKASPKSDKLLARVDKLSTKLSNLDIEMQQLNADFNKKVSTVRGLVDSVSKSCPARDFPDLQKKHNLCETNIHELKSQIQKLFDSMKTLEMNKCGSVANVTCRDTCGCAKEIIALKRNYGLMCRLVAKKLTVSEKHS